MHRRLVIWVKYRCRRKCRTEVGITRHGYLPWWRGRKQSTEAYLHPKMIGFAVPLGNLALRPTIPHFRALSCMRSHYRLVAAKSWPINSGLFSFCQRENGENGSWTNASGFSIEDSPANVDRCGCGRKNARTGNSFVIKS